MKVNIDPSLHIVDTNSAFFIVTKYVNLELKIKTEEKRQKVYRILDDIRSEKDISKFLNSNSPFDKKIINILLENKIISQERDFVEKEIPKLNKLYGPYNFLEIIKKELMLEENIKVINGESYLSISRDEYLDKIHVYLTNDSLYISNQKIPFVYYMKKGSENYIKYAAFVFLEKILLEELNFANDDIYKIDLRTYTNEVKRIIKQPIDCDNFTDSYLADSNISGNKICFDYESFYPYVKLNFFDFQKNKNIITVGLNIKDAIKNLLTLIENEHVGCIVIKEEKVEKHGEFTLGSDSFFKKIFYLYFNTNLIINETNNSKTYLLDDKVIEISNSIRNNQNSLFMSLYLNNFNFASVKGVVYEIN